MPERFAPGSGGGAAPTQGAAGGGSTTGHGSGSDGSDGTTAAVTPSAGVHVHPSDGAHQPAARLTPPRVITSAGTDYPMEAFRLTVRRQDLGAGLAVDGEEGTVGVRALVLADGTVSRVDVIASAGAAALDGAAAAAVKRWLFAPALRDSVPIDAYVTLRIRYVVR